MALTPASELIMRNQTELSGRVLFAHIPDDGLLNQLSQLENPIVLTDDWRSFTSMQHQPKLEPVFQSQVPDIAPVDKIVLFMPKAKEQARYLIAQLLPLLKEGAEFWLVGENNGGIKSADKLLLPFTDKVQKKDKAKKSTLLSMIPVVDKIPAFELEQWQQYWSLDSALNAEASDGSEIDDRSESALELVSLPGVFSHGRLDEGSELLLQHLPKVRASVGFTPKVLDMGCGCGVIGLSLLKQQPELALTACDVSVMAVEATQLSLAHNQLEGEVIASDMWSEVEGRYDLVISNPPFHTGLKTDYGPTEQFIRQAKKHLNRGGELRIVANRFLKYPDLIEQVFGNCERIAETGKFCIWSARVQI